ncbi:HlyD family efflux transporter periplasmic adaptor subunit [Pleurocapsales cyanobacterium LEGE 10410]|nr:HlyD family efflux transporter periplasmic adaptor subunit [Pleurocapsales cyanobacterium LEGE 10410]
MGKLQLKLEPNSKSIIALCLAGLAFVGATTIYSVNQNTTREENQTVLPQPVTAVTALGRIEPQGKLIQLAPAPDLGGTKIAQLLVEEGDRLTSGQIIAILDNYQRAKAAVELARQEVIVAQAELAVVEAGAKQGDIKAQAATLNRITAQLEGEVEANQADIARLQAQLATEQAEKQATIARRRAELGNAASEFKRYQQLARDRVISESELDARRLTVDTAQNALLEAQSSYNFTTRTLQQQLNQAQAIARQNKDTLQQQIIEAQAVLDSVSEVREVDVIQAQAEVDRAIAAWQLAEEDLELTYLKAPSDGQIIKINAYPGEIVDTDGVVEFADTLGMMVVAEVYESDIPLVEIGQTATIESETRAFAGEIMGKVKRIGLKVGKQDVLDTDPAADVDSRVIEVEIHLDPQTSDRVAHLTNSKASVKIDLEVGSNK